MTYGTEENLEKINLSESDLRRKKEICFRNAGLRLQGTKRFSLTECPRYDQTYPAKGELLFKKYT